MGICVVECISGRELALADDLTDSGHFVLPLSYRIERFNQRKSVITERRAALFPGYLLVDGQPDLRRATRMWCRYLLDRDGIPVKVNPKTVTDTLSRAAAGEFDVILHRNKKMLAPEIGASVYVAMLGRIGTVLKIVGKFVEVAIDGVVSNVRVPLSGLAPV